ncbi:uncharacterized protein LOC126990346 [Eriocheir sinensis]|uniref:uncharacterized protein LOC126990346 n=1 Tax=Eriocheir sinensis TaxID=95602 RepID=UPI0021C8D43F|nr:uncharacterized protein LOC126990346 [Eriocheir sinensis]
MADTPRSRHQLVLLSANVRGPRTNIGDLTHSFVLRHRVDIAVVTETWLNSEVELSFARIPGYTHWIRRDRQGRQGGGVAVCLKEGVQAQRLEVETPPTTEAVFLKVILADGTALLLCAMYRPPSSPQPSLTPLHYWWQRCPTLPSPSLPHSPTRATSYKNSPKQGDGVEGSHKPTTGQQQAYAAEGEGHKLQAVPPATGQHCYKLSTGVKSPASTFYQFSTGQLHSSGYELTASHRFRPHPTPTTASPPRHTGNTATARTVDHTSYGNTQPKASSDIYRVTTSKYHLGRRSISTPPNPLPLLRNTQNTENTAAGLRLARSFCGRHRTSRSQHNPDAITVHLGVRLYNQPLDAFPAAAKVFQRDSKAPEKNRRSALPLTFKPGGKLVDFVSELEVKVQEHTHNPPLAAATALQAQSKASLTCRFCKRSGHSENTCYSKRRDSTHSRQGSDRRSGGYRGSHHSSHRNPRPNHQRKTAFCHVHGNCFHDTDSCYAIQ